jgi:hypothetical protein
MKSPNFENVIVDEVRQITYVVVGRKFLTEGEIYSAIRVELLRRAGNGPVKGDKLIIMAGDAA